MATKSFTTACKEYFGLRPGTKLTAFAGELKDLTYEDKVEMAPLLGEVLGCEVTVTAPKS